MCVEAKNLPEIHCIHHFVGSRSFKLIDVGTRGKLVKNACYDQQQASADLEPFSC